MAKNTPKWAPFALFWIAFSMFVAVSLADSIWPSNGVLRATEPTPSPETGAGAGPGDSGAIGWTPPSLLITTMFSSLAFLLPMCLSVF
ncbi:hypothetical protein CsatA_017334 [Cannabis sativa]